MRRNFYIIQIEGDNLYVYYCSGKNTISPARAPGPCPILQPNHLKRVASPFQVSGLKAWTGGLFQYGDMAACVWRTVQGEYRHISRYSPSYTIPFLPAVL